MKKNYFIGLDIGTDSIGWAVTDTDYNLIKDRGSDFWGSYLFDTASTAEERRSFRTSRRRLHRTRHRLMLLQEIFDAEVSKTDPLFFIRLNNSNLVLEDKDQRVRVKNYLFDGSYGDKEYFKEYPTIEHLRKALVNEGTNDIRLLYLAVHHIIKNRGNFLFEGQDFNTGDASSAEQSLYTINALLEESESEELLCFENVRQALEVLGEVRYGKKEKEKKLKEIFRTNKNKRLSAVVAAICGCKFSLNDLIESEEEFGENSKLIFDESFDEIKLAAVCGVLTGEEESLLRALKSVYDWSVLNHILQGEKFLSYAKVKQFETHKADLAELKSFIKSDYPEKYKYVFRREKDVKNYAAYIGMDKNHSFSVCTKKEFYDFLNKNFVLPESIKEKMNRGEFLPKLRTSANGVIPYQVHLAELRAILDSCEKNFPFLRQVSEGLSIKEKIISLLEFRIPYYVGPLSTNGRFSWMKKREGVDENSRITPWNFEKIVDKDASEQAFISRMTNKCTYLFGEDVLPESSLLYSRFTFLNELNNLKINGEKSSKGKRLILEYAKQNKKVTLKKCLALLVDNGLVEKGKKVDEVFSGIDGDFKKGLSSYVDFKKILGDMVDTHTEMIEKIILWITVISDKNRLEKLILKEYGNIISEDNVKQIKGLNYTKWGRLSKTLLSDIKCGNVADENGEPLSIIRAMELGTENFMELLSDKYGFRQAIDDYNSEGQTENVCYKTIENLYCSPAVKRSIWRTVCIVKEIVKAEGCMPRKIFIEMARDGADNGKKGRRTYSRKQQLLELYKNIKDECREWISDIQNTPDKKFDSDKLFFYYIQKGRDMYTGKPIALGDVFNAVLYDIDHIYPQSKIKDDSLNNRVLVHKTINMGKSDVYPLSVEIRHNMYPFWRQLRDEKLISDEKFYRLTRNSPLNEEEMADFINRQLVETRQSTKAVAQILKNLLPETEVVYAKASNADKFKKTVLDLVKVRELNDLHHAKDAYANIIVGNIYDEKFNHNAKIYFKKHGVGNYNLNKLFFENIEGVWGTDYIERVKRIARKNSCRVVRFTSAGKGKMFDATIKTKGANENLIPLKEAGPISNTAKYGGYDSATTAYFMLVRSLDKKGGKMLSLERMTIYGVHRFGNMGNSEYCKHILNLVEPEVLIDNIKINTLFNINGSYAYLRGVSSGGKTIVLCNANQLLLDEENTKYLKLISNTYRDKKKNNAKEINPVEGICAAKNLILYDVFIQKLSSPVYGGLNISAQAKTLISKREVFIELSIKNQCEVLWEILHFMQCNPVLSDLTLIGGGSRTGSVTIGNKLSGYKVLKMIEQSPTGRYRKITDLTEYL